MIINTEVSVLLSPDWRLENARVETSPGKRLLIFVNYSVRVQQDYKYIQTFLKPVERDGMRRNYSVEINFDRSAVFCFLIYLLLFDGYLRCWAR